MHKFTGAIVRTEYLSVKQLSLVDAAELTLSLIFLLNGLNALNTSQFVALLLLSLSIKWLLSSHTIMCVCFFLFHFEKALLLYFILCLSLK